MADISLPISYIQGASYGSQIRNRIISAITAIQQDLETFKQAFDVDANDLMTVLSNFDASLPSTYYEDLINYMTVVASSAYADNSKVTKAIFPNASKIGDYAFNGCTNLSSVSFPVCSEIGAHAFRSAIFESAAFPSAITIGDCAFIYCSNLTELSLPLAETIGTGAFIDCDKLYRLSLPSAITVNDLAFAGCDQLSIVDLPLLSGSVLSSVFYRCNALTSVNAPLVTDVYDNAFDGCANLVTVNMSSLVTIGAYAFANCTSLSYVDVSSATHIGGYAFAGCQNLRLSSFYASVIGNYAFSGAFDSSCTVTFYSLSGFSSRTFQGCRAGVLVFPDVSRTKTCELPNECPHLSTIRLGNTPLQIKNIGPVKTSALRNLYIGGEYLPELTTYDSPYTYSSAWKNIKIHVPSSLVSAYKQYGGWSYLWMVLSSVHASLFVGDYS